MPDAWTTTCRSDTIPYAWGMTASNATVTVLWAPDVLATATTAWMPRHTTATTATSTTGFFTCPAQSWGALADTPLRSDAEQAEVEGLAGVRRAAWRDALAEQERARTVATTRAEVLLKAHLDIAQRQQYEAEHCFDVGSADGARTYRLSHGVTHNVTLLDAATGQPVRTYCAHPVGDLPVADVLLAQMLLLTCDEAAFLRVANVRNLL